MYVPEIEAGDLATERRNDRQDLLLDCREPHEWREVRIPDSLHIPMYQVPHRLAELDGETPITVVCAHGVRSYAVAEYLIRNGFKARSLKGGIEAWQMHGGEVERG